MTNQDQHTQQLHKILELNTRLISCDSEPSLLDEAASGICQLLDLVDVTIFEWSASNWLIRTTSSPTLKPGMEIPPTLAEDLNTIASEELSCEQFVRKFEENDTPTGRITSPLLTDGSLIGAVITHTGATHDLDEVPFLVKSFTTNLAVLWNRLNLLTDSQQRARQLEALQGPQFDNIGPGEGALVVAHYENRVLEFERKPTETISEPNGSPLTNERSIPLVIGDRLMGDLSLPADITLEEEEIDFVEALLREMGNALNNAQLLQTTRSYSAQLQVAAEVSRAATTILEQDVLTHRVVDLVRNNFDLYYVGLFLIDENDDAVLIAGTGNAGKVQIEQGHKLPVGSQSMIGQAIDRDTAIVEQDVTQAADWRPNPHLPDTRAELALPLHTRGRTIGALTVQSTQTGAFTSENITVLQTVADQMATAIENASLFAQIQENLAETNRLYSRSRSISETTDTLSVYQELIDFAAESDMFDMAHVMLPDPTSPDYLISPILWSRHGVEFNPLDRFAHERFAFNVYLSKKDITIIGDVLEDELVDENTRQIFIRAKVRSTAILPIHSEDRWLGSLVLYRLEPNPPSRQDLQPFLTLCDQAAIIIDNQQLLNETEALYRVSRAMNQAETTLEAYELTLAEIVRYSGLEQCHIVLYNDMAGFGEIVAHFNQENPPAQTWLPMEEDLIYRELLNQKRPLLIDKNNSDTNQSAVEIYLTPLGLNSSMLIPAISKNQLLGFIALDSYSTADYFHRSNVAYAQAVADQFTITLESIRRFEEIREANNRLRELDQLKTQFLANMSHELRTPLNSIIGFSRVILKGIDGPVTAEQEEDLTSIHNSGQHLLSLINDILDVARIEAGKMSLAFEEVDVEEMAKSVNATVRGLVKDKDIELLWKIEEGLPNVEADPIRLRQILLNFLSNAAKFTEKGYITLYIVQEGEHHIHLAVEDTGIGIAEEDFDILFEAFEQVDSSVTRSFGGTGLGLPITKKLIELHHGQVWMESEVGKGSTFHIMIPIHQEYAGEDLPEPTRYLKYRFSSSSEKKPEIESKPTILLVDDEPGVVNLYERYLQSCPYQLLRANSGMEALQIIQENDNFIRLVLLDINMPGLTGWDVLQQMHDNPETKDISVIVCSIENDPDKATALGARKSLLKPIVEDDLIHALKELGIQET